MEWILAVAINCSEPRLPFRTFFEQIYVSPYPGHRMEDMTVVNRRMVEGVASYVDYAEAYRDKCGARKR